MSCSFTGCDNPVRAKGFCTGHYQQTLRDGRKGLRPLRVRIDRVEINTRVPVEVMQRLRREAKTRRMSVYAWAGLKLSVDAKTWRVEDT